jgi:pimeloyl-ACP methyl ester carboxylesterase
MSSTWVAVVCASLGAAEAAATDADLLVGEWVGEFKLGANISLLKIHCRKGKKGIEATADIPPFGSTGVVLTNVRSGPASASFELGAGPARMHLEARLEGADLVGQVQQGDERGALRLVRLAQVDPMRLSAYRGAYRAGPNRFIWVSSFGELGGGLFFLDSQSGRFGPLYPKSETLFFSGQGVVIPLFPEGVRIAFSLSGKGKAEGLTFRRREGAEVRALRVPLETESVNFRDGTVSLAGTLTRPESGGQSPAIVMVHGSGPEDRDFLGVWVEFFASQGLAVLAYDKRGVGASGGDWKRANIDDLAKDAAAALGFLRSRTDIDPKRIGIFAISQGGWVAPRAARLSGAVAFLILHAPAAVTPARQGLLSIKHELRAYGFPQADVDEAIAYYELDDAFTRTGEGWEKLQDTYQKASARKAEWALPPRLKDDWFRPFYRGLMDYDPVSDLERLTFPTLAFFGGLDLTVPVEPNKTILENALRKAGNKDHTVVVLPQANHMFLQAKTGLKEEYARLQQFVPGYFDRMGDWLKQRRLAER